MQLVFDIEGDHLEYDKVKVVHCICTKDLETENEYHFEGKDIPAGAAFLAQAARLIGHNIIWYDLPVLQKLCGLKYKGIVIDTLLLSRLLNPDRMNPFNYTGKAKPHSIEVWGHRFGREPKIQIEDFSVFTPEMFQRCKEDVRTNLEVYRALFKEAQE